MKAFIKSYWKTLLFFALVGAVGGFGVGFYLLDSYPEDMVQALLAQGMTPVLLALVTAVQSAGYGIVLGGIGIRLAKKVGLWRNERSIEGKPLLYTVIISVIGIKPSNRNNPFIFCCSKQNYTLRFTTSNSDIFNRHSDKFSTIGNHHNLIVVFNRERAYNFLVAS